MIGARPMPVTIGASLQPTNRAALYYYDIIGSPT